MADTAINDLPDSAFAYIEPGGTKDDQGKTTPRSLRHFPIHDEAHVRNALARLSQSPFGSKARAKVEAAARKMGIGAPAGKSDFDMKAEALTKKKTEQWLDGDIGRRVLMVPFTGPLPGGKAGLDLDGEYFDEATDIYGPYPGLKATRWREMDWHHDDSKVPSVTQGGPALSMKGLLIGEVELDEDPEDFGHWATWWIRQGEANRQRIAAARVAALEQMGQPLWGSSQALFKKKATDGHIEVWPIYRHTASTSPRNDHAVIPALKAVVDDLSPDDLSSGAMTALLVGLSDLVPDLRATSSDDAADTFVIESGEPVAKAGRRNSAADASALQSAHDAIASTLGLDCGAKGAVDPVDRVLEELALAVAQMH